MSPAFYLILHVSHCSRTHFFYTPRNFFYKNARLEMPKIDKHAKNKTEAEKGENFIKS